jgi:aminoglycoside phosphotransferase (APT) family kinase protein
MGNAWAPEIVVEKELAITLISKQFPAISIQSIKEIGEGFDNTIFAVNDQYVFRFPRRKIAGDLIETEAVLLPIIHQILPIKIPVPVFFGENSEEYKWSFLGYHYLSGMMPYKLAKEERTKLIRPLGEFLKSLHSISISQLKDLPIPYDTLGRLDIGKRKAGMAEKLETLLVLDNCSVFQKARKYCLELEHIDVPKEHVLVHGDLHLRNMLVNECKELTAVIDWGDVHIGHRAVDLSIVFSLIPADEREAFFAVYSEVDSLSLELAKFKSVYTLVLLLAYAADKKERALYEEAKTSLAISLS